MPAFTKKAGDVAAGSEGKNVTMTLAGQKSSARELFRQSATALGIPADKLSLSLLTFARFFSLSFDQAIVVLRREALASSKSSSPQSAKEKAAFEAKALALTAALDKGVTLSPEALERYARYLGPPAFAEDRETGKDNAIAGDGSEHGSGSGYNDSDRGGGKESPDRDEVPQEGELRAIAEKEAKEDGLLDYMNSFPGKNGQFWMVFPLIIKVKGTELKVFIRLLKGEPFSLGEDEHLILDIAGPKRQYRCYLKKNASRFRADIGVYPKLSPRALKALSKEAEHFLGTAFGGNFPGFEEVLVRNEEEVPSWVEDLCAEPLPSINEEV